MTITVTATLHDLADYLAAEARPALEMAARPEMTEDAQAALLSYAAACYRAAGLDFAARMCARRMRPGCRIASA